MKEKEEIKVSQKNVALRMGLFIFFFIIGLTLIILYFTGVLQFQKGYKKVTLNASNSTINNSSTVDYYLYVDGNNVSVNKSLKNASSTYSNEVNYIYQLIDEEHTYDGVNNLAYINSSENLNKDIRIEKALYDILLDGYNKTKENKNYSLYSSYLYELWDSINSGYKVDPLGDENVKKEISDYLLYINNYEESITLQFKENNTINLNISEEYKTYREDNEITSPIISLNILKDAYIMDYIQDKINDTDYTNGYLISKNGYIVTLKDYKNASISLNTIISEDSKKDIVNYANIKVEENHSYVLFNYFDYYQNKINVIKDSENKNYYRSNIVSLESGYSSSIGLSFFIRGNDILSNAYNLLYITSLDEEKIKVYADSLNLNLIYTKEDNSVNLINIDKDKELVVISKRITINQL